MTWAQRLKRVLTGRRSASILRNVKSVVGQLVRQPGRIIVDASNRSIEDPDVIKKILKHLGVDQPADPHNRSPPVDLTAVGS